MLVVATGCTRNGGLKSWWRKALSWRKLHLSILRRNTEWATGWKVRGSNPDTQATVSCMLVVATGFTRNGGLKSWWRKALSWRNLHLSILRRNAEWATGWTVRGSNPETQAKDYSFLPNIQRTLAHYILHKMWWWGLLPVVKGRGGDDGKHQTPSRAKIKNGWSCIGTPHTHLTVVVRDKTTLSFYLLNTYISTKLHFILLY